MPQILILATLLIFEYAKQLPPDIGIVVIEPEDEFEDALQGWDLIYGRRKFSNCPEPSDQSSGDDEYSYGGDDSN